jgi:hypothetical protein
MTNVLPPLGDDGLIPAMWSAFAQQINGAASVAAGAASNPARFSLDQYGNVNAIYGALDQVVEIGAAYQQYGVFVGTNLAGFGVATPSGFASTMITTTAGSTAATVVSATGFANGYVIGAIQVSGPYEEPDTTTVVSNVITPGTTYTVSGLNVTLSANALIGDGATPFYCASVLFSQTGSAVHP